MVPERIRHNTLMRRLGVFPYLTMVAAENIVIRELVVYPVTKAEETDLLVEVSSALNHYYYQE